MPRRRDGDYDDGHEEDFAPPPRKNTALMLALAGAAGALGLACAGWAYSVASRPKALPQAEVKAPEPALAQAPAPAEKPPPKGQSKEAPPPGEPDLTIPQAFDLHEEFKANEAAADAKYLGKVVRFRDYPVRVRKAADGSYWAEFSGELDKAATAAAKLHPSAAARAATLKAGTYGDDNRVWMKGVCRGARPAINRTGLVVVFENCVFTDAPQ